MTYQSKSEQPKTRIPAPLYAAAGVGDLAYQQLRKLPALVNELSGRAVANGAELREKSTELRERAAERLKTANVSAAGLRERAAGTELDVDRLRELARRNAAAFAATAQAAQAKAVAVYGDLVARGALVVGDAAETVTEDAVAEVAAATAPAELPAAAPAAATPAATAKPAKPAKAAKRTRPAAN